MSKKRQYKNNKIKLNANLSLGRQEVGTAKVHDYKRAVCNLSATNKVTRIWVPGHSGRDDNEKSDITARQGSEENFMDITLHSYAGASSEIQRIVKILNVC